ncbi:MAG: hypothetical protein PVJ75_09870 [Chloroflexota bacterium]
MPDPLTILLVVAGIAILWILFRILLNMAAALFRIGCFIIFVIAVGVAIWYALA